MNRSRTSISSAAIRRAACERLRFLGVAIDPDRNHGVGDREVSPPDVRVRVLAVHACEDLEITRETRRLLSGDLPHEARQVRLPLVSRARRSE